ncbi:uncharacterized protein EV422DRAFT_163320 [Fimicolochytrium jonesii]|uniref:uncharacterized protein n=1 Tax=Fimicolochytrium jonesii TaxID=1396493 RepID=UPI0022FE8F24|nr:uncharacterized protein EV422DRAFT_163320 [Fimicolochytrium jonesii]KAI8818743.1 hypothetical protein EV422DRAFT_163320 [Fimicolochytrium jonesii]
MSSPHTPGGSGRQGNNSPEVGAGDGPPQYRVAFPQPMAYQESASSAHVGRRSYTHNGYAGSSPQPPSRSFPAFPTMPMEDPLEPSSSNDPHASNDVGSCLHLLLSLADELARFRIEDIRNAALTHDEPDGVLRTVRMVSVFCSEIETALQNRTGRVNTLKGKGKAPAVLSTPPLFSERLTPTPHSAGSTDYYPANEHYHAAERPVDATFGHDPIEPAPVAGSSDAASAQDTNVYTCYHEVVADPSDELAINIKLMDRVKLDIEMDDGLTGIGTNLNTGAMGSFPLSCIVVPDDVDTGPLPRRGPSLGSVRGSGTATSSPAPTRNSSITGHSAPFIPNVNLAAAHAPSLPEPVLATPVNDVTASPVLGPSSHAMHLSTADGLPRTGSVKSLSSFHSDGSGRPMSGHLGGSPWGAATGPEEYPAVGNQQPLPVRAASIQSSSSATSKADVPPTSHTPSHTAVDATGFADPKSRLINPYANLQEHSQPPPLSAQVIEKRKFARQVVTELYETEKNFRDGMQILIDQFMVPLAQCIFTSTTTSPDSENAVITKMEHSMLFRNIPGLRNLSKKICGLLKDALDRAESDQEGPTGGGAVTAVVDVFLSNVEFEEWSTYVRYMEGYAHAKQTLTTMKKRVAFTTMLERCESAKECNRYTFDHYMILPVQRIGRYHLLLGRLKKVTDEEDPVHQAYVVCLFPPLPFFMEM